MPNWQYVVRVELKRSPGLFKPWQVAAGEPSCTRDLLVWSFEPLADSLFSWVSRRRVNQILAVWGARAEWKRGSRTLWEGGVLRS